MSKKNGMVRKIVEEAISIVNGATKESSVERGLCTYHCCREPATERMLCATHRRADDLVVPLPPARAKK